MKKSNIHQILKFAQDNFMEATKNGKCRTYFVIDMKSFFASVECAERGLDAMKTKLVVADESRTEKTICLAVSPALKEMGIKNRCRLFEIPKNIEFQIASPRMKKYIEYAANIYAIYLKYIDKSDIHVYSIDESFIDATDYLKIYNLSAKEFAQKLMNEITNTLHIPCSCGIGTNLFLAKIALDIMAKHSPERIGFLSEESFRKILWRHEPLSDFWQVSRGTIERLAKHGIYTMYDIAHADENILFKEFGINAELLIDHAYGKESCLMSDIKSYKSKSKSISSSQILPCNYNFSDAKLVMQEMIQNGCYDLTKNNFVTNSVQLFVGYGDNKFDTSKGLKHLGVTTNLYSIISTKAEELFDEIAEKNRPIRRIGYNFPNLISDENEQYNLFSDVNKIEKEKKLVKSILSLQEKYGKNSVLRGQDLKENATQIARNKTIGGHKSGEN